MILVELVVIFGVLVLFVEVLLLCNDLNWLKE